MGSANPVRTRFAHGWVLCCQSNEYFWPGHPCVWDWYDVDQGIPAECTLSSSVHMTVPMCFPHSPGDNVYLYGVRHTQSEIRHSAFSFCSWMPKTIVPSASMSSAVIASANPARTWSLKDSAEHRVNMRGKKSKQSRRKKPRR